MMLVYIRSNKVYSSSLYALYIDFQLCTVIHRFTYKFLVVYGDPQVYMYIDFQFCTVIHRYIYVYSLCNKYLCLLQPAEMYIKLLCQPYKCQVKSNKPGRALLAICGQTLEDTRHFNAMIGEIRISMRYKTQATNSTISY